MLGADANLLSQPNNECPERSLCDFLTLPGIWELGGEQPTYQTLDPYCQLRDLVTELLSFPEEPISTQDTHSGILFLGDSVDRLQLHVICSEEILRSTVPAHETESYWACKRGPFSFHLQTMAGVHPTGPYPLNVKGSPRDRLIHVRSAGWCPLLVGATQCKVIQSRFVAVGCHQVPPDYRRST